MAKMLLLLRLEQWSIMQWIPSIVLRPTPLGHQAYQLSLLIFLNLLVFLSLLLVFLSLPVIKQTLQALTTRLSNSSRTMTLHNRRLKAMASIPPPPTFIVRMPSFLLQISFAKTLLLLMHRLPLLPRSLLWLEEFLLLSGPSSSSVSHQRRWSTERLTLSSNYLSTLFTNCSRSTRLNKDNH